MNHLRRRKLQPWPKPHESIAMQIDTGTKTMSGSLAWVPKGPALEIYNTKIHPELEATLANIEITEDEIPLFLKLYMMGRDEASANPIVMVCCVQKATRKKVEIAIRASRILDRFPGFGLGSSALQLGSHSPEGLLTMEHERGNKPQAHEDGRNPGNTLGIYGSTPLKLGGTIKFVSSSHGEGHVVHSATGGPIFQLGTELYQVTAGHGIRFDTPAEQIHYSASELDECEFDSQFESDLDDDIVTSKGSITPEASSSRLSDGDPPSSRLSWEEVSQADLQPPVGHDLCTRTRPDGSVERSSTKARYSTGDSEPLSLEHHNPELDYALLKLPDQLASSDLIADLNSTGSEADPVTNTAHVGPGETKVIVVSPDGPMLGVISHETTSYKMRGFTKLQQLLTVHLLGVCQVFLKGYSGSAVVDAVTGAFYGLITLGSPGQLMAYCVRAPDILADVLSRLGHVPILDQRYWLANSRNHMRTTGVPLSTEPATSGLSDDWTDISEGKTTSSGYNSNVGSRSHKGKRDNHKGEARKEEWLDPDHQRHPFACPFYLNDRHDWHSCLRNYTLNRIVDVRLHLLRVHLLPPQCPDCGEEFEGDWAEDQCNAHIQLRCCQQLPAAPPPRRGVTGDQLEAIRVVATRRTGRRGQVGQDSAAAKWFEMWDIIFPNTTRPASPYITEHPDVQRIMDMTKSILSRESWVNDILATRRSSPSLLQTSRSAVVAITNRLIAGFRQMYDDPGERPPGAVKTVAGNAFQNPMDLTLHRPQGLDDPDAAAQAEDDLLPWLLAPGTTRLEDGGSQHVKEFYSSGVQLNDTWLTPGSRTCPPSHTDSSTDAHTQESVFCLQAEDDTLCSRSVREAPGTSHSLNNLALKDPGSWNPSTENTVKSPSVHNRPKEAEGMPSGLGLSEERTRVFEANHETPPDPPSPKWSEACGIVADDDPSVGVQSSDGESSHPDGRLTLGPGHPLATATGELKTMLVDRWMSMYSSASDQRALSSTQKSVERLMMSGANPGIDVQLASASKHMEAVGHQDSDAPWDFVCPFYLMDKMKHKECLTRNGLSTIDDLKEHMWVSHGPPISCPTCKGTFATLSARNEHIRDRNCDYRKLQAFESLTDRQMQRIALPASPKYSSRQDQWYEVWDIIYPSGPSPFSPYYSSELEFRIMTLRQFWEENGRNMVSDFLKDRQLQRWKGTDEQRILNILYKAVLHDAIDEVYRGLTGGTKIAKRPLSDAA